MPSDEQQPGPAYFTVDPDKLWALKKGFEQEAETVRAFLRKEGDALAYGPQFGADPRSDIVAGELRENGLSAIRAVEGYANVLHGIAKQLEESARAYGLTEDENTNTFRGGLE